MHTCWRHSPNFGHQNAELVSIECVINSKYDWQIFKVQRFSGDWLVAFQARSGMGLFDFLDLSNWLTNQKAHSWDDGAIHGGDCSNDTGCRNAKNIIDWARISCQHDNMTRLRTSFMMYTTPLPAAGASIDSRDYRLFFPEAVKYAARVQQVPAQTLSLHSKTSKLIRTRRRHVLRRFPPRPPAPAGF